MADQKATASTGAERRRERLAQELRANLLKRKQQVRARRDDPVERTAGSDTGQAPDPENTGDG